MQASLVKILARIAPIWENRDHQTRQNIYELGFNIVEQEVVFYNFLLFKLFYFCFYRHTVFSQLIYHFLYVQYFIFHCYEHLGIPATYLLVVFLPFQRKHAQIVFFWHHGKN